MGGSEVSTSVMKWSEV